MLPTIESVPGLTTFEVTTALAFLYFQREEGTWRLWEVGLGGRLDATNVVTPEISVMLTSPEPRSHLLARGYLGPDRLRESWNRPNPASPS